MAIDEQAAAVARARVVLPIEAPGIRVQRDLPYGRTVAGPLVMDLHHPPEAAAVARPTPAVVFVTGYADAGARARFGRNAKDMGAYASWGELAASSGMIGVTYVNEDPVSDVRVLFRHLRDHGARYGVDANRIGIWSCSGNVPNALGLLIDGPRDGLRCAAISYGFTLDLDGANDVAEAARQWRFANPCEGKSVDELPADIPLFVARAGRDEFPGLNRSMDRFLLHAIRRNLPIAFVNHPEGPHAFDLFQDSATTRLVVRDILRFLRAHLVDTSGA